MPVEVHFLSFAGMEIISKQDVLCHSYFPYKNLSFDKFCS